MSEPVRWGVLGCARIAINQVIPAMKLTDKAVLWGVASRTLSKAEGVAAQFGAKKAYGSYEEMLNDPEIEAVYIPLPNGLHKPWSIAALQAGKHVLCEKPLALDAEEARAMEAVSKETGRILLEAFAYRFNTVVLKAMEIARSGAMGDLKMIYSSQVFPLKLDPQDVRLQDDIGGGALYDVGCYSINVQRMLAGREPRAAWARLTWSDRFNVDLSGAGVLDFGDDLWGTFDMGFNAPGGSYFRVVGTQGKLEAPQGFSSRQGTSGLYLTTGGNTEAIETPEVNGYTMEVQDLSEAVRGEHAPRYGWEPLDATMRVIDACYASNKTGRLTDV